MSPLLEILHKLIFSIEGPCFLVSPYFLWFLIIVWEEWACQTYWYMCQVCTEFLFKIKDWLTQQWVDANHRSLLKNKRLKTLQGRDWRKVIQGIAGELIKGIYTTWAVWGVESPWVFLIDECLHGSSWQVDFEKKFLRWVWSQRFGKKDIL
jgi:hypothetical protein